MINNVIDILKTRLALSGLVSQSYGLCELVTDAKGQTSPKEYCGSDQWNEVSDYGNYSGVSYWRKSGDISMSESTGNVACDRFIDFTIPLYLVIAVRKSVLNDDQYTPDAIATTIIRDLIGNSSVLKSAVGARRAAVSVTGYDTDAESVMAREYNAVDAARIRTDYAHISLNVSVAISIKSDCIPNDCSPSDSCERLLASLTNSELLDCILPSYDFADTTTLDHLTAQQESDLESALCTCADATVTIKNSVGTTIDSGSVASGGNGLFTITDSTAVVKNSAGTVLATEAIPAEVSEDVAIADITKTDTDGTVSAVPAGVNVTCTPTSSLTCAQLNIGLNDSQRQTIQRITLIKTGQTTSYRTGDDGDLEKGRLPTFTTLTCNNGFGNTNRFTDTLGGQTYANDLVVDWATGLMWYRALSGLVNWNTAIDNCEASAKAGYTNWRLPNMSEMISIVNCGVSGGLNYSPFNITTLTTSAYIWTNTTSPGLSTYAVIWLYGYSLAQYRGTFNVTLKTESWRHLMCRNFTLPDLGL